MTLGFSSGDGGGGGSSSSAKYLRTQSFVNKTALTGQTMSSGGTLYKVDTTVTNYYNTRTKYQFDITYTNSSKVVSVTSKINDGTASTQTFNSKDSNLSESYNTYTQNDYVYDFKEFTQGLETFTALTFLSDGTKILKPCKLKMYPYFLEQKGDFYEK